MKRKIQSRFRFLGIQLINITSGIELAISGVVDYKDLDDFVGNDPTQTSEVKNPHRQHFLIDIKNCTSITVASATT